LWHGKSMAALIFCRRQQTVKSPLHHQSCVWIDYVGDTVIQLI